MNDKEFIGRHEELEEFKEFLSQEKPSLGSKDRYAQLLLVVGDKGIGKRSLLQAMAQQANDQNHYVIPSNIYKTKDFKEQIHYLIATIRRKKRLNLGKGEDWFRIGIAALSIPAPGVSNIANVLYQIDEEHKKENYNGDYLAMMLLDALSKLDQKTGANERIVILLYPEKVNPLDQEGESPLELIPLLEYIEARGMPPKVRFVIAQRPQDVIIEAVRKGEPANLRDMCAKFMEVGKMDPNESRQFIRLYDTGHKLDEAMEQVFLERYGGWPRLMKLALDELQKETGEITEEIMKSLPKLVDDFWERRYKEIRDNKPEAALNVVQTVSLLPHPYEYDDVELFSNLEPVAMERVAIKDAPVNRYLEIKDWPDSFTGKLRENCLHTIHATAKEYVVNLLKNSINKRIYRQRLNNIASHYEDKIEDDFENVDRDTLAHLFPYMMEAQSWDKLGNLLAKIAYLKRMQGPQEQYNFQQDFISLINNGEIPKNRLVNILQGVLNAICEQLQTSKEKADWLDTFAYWINEFGVKDCSERSLALKDVANKFDYACGDVSKELAKARLKKGDNDWALRFAELYTWVYERAGDYSKCVDAYLHAEEMGLQKGMEDALNKCVAACLYAEKMCLQEGMEDAYRYLGQAEFIRLRAHALTTLSNKIATDESKKTEYEAEAHKAYEELNKVFPVEGEVKWPQIKEWEEWEGLLVLEKATASEKITYKVLTPPSQSGSGKPGAFKAKVVSNLADSISAMHIIQFFEEQGGLVEWIHHENFEPEQFASEDTLFTVLIGGPKSPGISTVAYEFLETDREKFLKMYSGMSFGAHRLQLEKRKTHCYMLGGPSKVNTLMAAYEFATDGEAKRLIEKGQPSNE